MQELWEEAHPGARASRPHATPLRAAQFPCDAAPSHSGGGYGMGSAEAESWLRCRSSRMEELAEAVPGPVRAGRPALPGGLHPLTPSHHRSSIGIRVHSWFVFNNQGKFFSSYDLPGRAGAELVEFKPTSGRMCRYELTISV